MVDYTAGLLAAIFAAYDISWLIPVIPLVGLAPLTLNTFCATDPPTMPTFSQAEVDAMLQLQLGPTFDSGLAKVRDLVLNVIWYDTCQCTAGSPTPIAPPAQPAGSITTIFPSAPATTPCLTFHPSTNPWGYTQGQSWNIGGAYFGGLNATASRLTLSTTVQSGSFVPGNWGLSFSDGVTTITPRRTMRYDQLVKSQVFDIPVQANQFLVTFEADPTPTGSQFTLVTAEIFCNGDYPGGVQTPCCPPDPATASTLALILDLVRSMQRNYAPFGYVFGSAHSGLTGTGSFAISRNLGVKLEVTAHPGSTVFSGGNPLYARDLGWISVSEADGMIQERRVSQLGFTWFPQLAPIATQVNYFLSPGVIATITELLPEP